MSDSLMKQNGLRSADFPGDEAYIVGQAKESYSPCLVVNDDIEEAELLSGAIHRLANASDLMWLVLDRANGTGDAHLEGGIVALGRLCNEAQQLCVELTHRIGQREKAGKSSKAGKVPK